MGETDIGALSATAGHARCGCGHFPTQHMVVVPDTPGKPGGFHLTPAGFCSVCGASVCARYHPVG